MQPSDQRSLGDLLLRGTLWMFAMRSSTILLGFVSLTVLARLLETADFGLVAMASAAIALPMVLSDLGIEQAIIRQPQPERSFYNTAWTIRAIQMGLAAACVYFAGPWIAGFYGEPRIAEIVPFLALAVIISGLENVWTVSFRKELKFRRDFSYNLACKMSAVLVTVTLALSLRSYWALVYGQLAAAVLRLAISLLISPELPRPTLSKWRQIWLFSQWSLVRGIAGFIVVHGDRLILGRILAPDTVGVYSIGREIAEMPISEISSPVNRALGPGLSTLQGEPHRLANALAKSLGAVATIAFPVAVGLALTAAQVIPVLLGNDWIEAVPILQILAIASLISAIRGVLGNTLVVIGHIRTSAVVMWVRALVLTAMGIPGAAYAGVEGMAGSFLISEAIAIAVSIYSYRQHLPEFTMSALGNSLVRPIISTIVMLGLVLALDQTVVPSTALLLVIKVVIGVLIYPMILYLSWCYAGRPDSFESTILDYVKSPLKTVWSWKQR